MEKNEMKYNDFIDKETLNIEYKKFTFNIAGLPIDIKQAEYYCNNNIFEFNTYVINNIYKYFECFLLKNVCAFMNSQINGDFYIGVNDLGFIEGIPYLGILPIELITKKMYEILFTYLKFKSNNEDNNEINLKEIIKINFINIKLPEKPTETIHPEYNRYLKKKRNIQNNIIIILMKLQIGDLNIILYLKN